MKGPDQDRERSEKTRSLADFLARYNENLPANFPQVTEELLSEFRETHGKFFRSRKDWSLDLHRKRVMDWLTVRSAASQREADRD